MLILKPLAFWNAACDNYQPLTGVYVSKSSSVRYTYYQIFPCFVVIESIFRSRKVKPKWNCFPSTLCLTLNNENGYSVGNNGSRYPLTIRSDYSLTKIQSIMLICSFIEFSSGSHNHDKTQQMSVNHKKTRFLENNQNNIYLSQRTFCCRDEHVFVPHMKRYLSQHFQRCSALSHYPNKSGLVNWNLRKKFRGI